MFWKSQSNQVINQTGETESPNLVKKGLAKKLVPKLYFCLYFYKTFFSSVLETNSTTVNQLNLLDLEDKLRAL